MLSVIGFDIELWRGRPRSDYFPEHLYSDIRTFECPQGSTKDRQREREREREEHIQISSLNNCLALSTALGSLGNMPTPLNSIIHLTY